jgi:deoxyribonuclease-4
MKFGPAGNSTRFYEEGYKRSEQAPAWIRAQGLEAYEYAAGRGVMISEKTARAIGEEAAKNGIAMSIHAPYFINCASAELARREKSIDYLLQAARAADWLGARRVVFHIGSQGKLERQAAFAFCEDTILRAHDVLDAQGFSHIALCPETMGRISQMGTLDEILALCAQNARLIPTLDFGHLHTINLGALNAEADFRAVLEKLVGALGHARARHFHAHFSRIEFGPKGEKRHVTFSDPDYGPDFAHLAPALVEMALEPTIICESAGTQADDALEMKRLVDKFRQNRRAQDCTPATDMV